MYTYIKNRSQPKCKQVENKSAPAKVRLQTTVKLAMIQVKNYYIQEFVTAVEFVPFRRKLLRTSEGRCPK